MLEEYVNLVQHLSTIRGHDLMIHRIRLIVRHTHVIDTLSKSLCYKLNITMPTGILTLC